MQPPHRRAARRTRVASLDHFGGLDENLTQFFRRWIDHIANPGDLGGRKAANLRVLADDGLICGQINAKRLIVRNVAFEPLDIGAKLAQGWAPSNANSSAERTKV